jgi:hypothetical protein
MGCLKQVFVQIGCLVVLLALVVFAFLYRDQLAAAYRRVRGLPPPPDSTAYVMADTARAAARPEAALERLAQRGGPAFVDLTAAQVAALVEQRLGPGRRLVDSIRVALVEPEVRVRGSVDLARVPRGALGPFAGAMDRRQPVTIAGTFDADSSGRLLLTVTGLSVGDFPFPRGTIGAVLRALAVPAAEGRVVPIPMDGRVSDARVRGATLRLYRFEAAPPP